MIFNKEQLDLDDFYLPDMNFGDLTSDQMLEIFNALPSHLQGMAVSWGFNDTCFRDDVFVWIVENQFGITTEEYYANNMWKNDYIFDFKKLHQSEEE